MIPSPPNGDPAANTNVCSGVVEDLEPGADDPLPGQVGAVGAVGQPTHSITQAGRTHDWSISRQVADVLRDRGRPVILAGGLSPENVAEAVRTVRPFAVDVNSGVEDAHGDKVFERCVAFVSRAREARAQPANAAA